jgi:arylsulfatase B
MTYDQSVRLLVVALTLVRCGSCLAAEANAQKPNIVIIVADDLGWKDVGYHGGDIVTPNLDRLATEGIQLENWHVAPLCSPTRAGLMTGRWPIRYGMGESVITPWRKWGLPTTERTIADLVATAGYERRGAVGKWHLGHYRKELLPLNRGFTSFYGHYNGAFDYFTHKREGERDWHRNLETSHDEGYSTDLIGREAAAFIDNSPADEPFFLYVPFNAPHDPMQAKEEDLKKYANVKQQQRRIYSAMVDSMDQAIGVILETLERKSVADNTFVLFFSDNGALSWGNNNPWRSGKGSVYEGGVRTPAMVRWPAGGISGGGKVDGMMGMIDVYPTIKRLVGVDAKDGNRLDGIDVLDVMRGKKKAPVRDWFSYIAQGRPDQAAVCDDTWKLVVTNGSVLDVVLDGNNEKTPKAELFRLDRDPAESKNVLSDHPDVAAAMLQRLQAFRRLKIDGIPHFLEGKQGFVAPTNWVIE